MINLSLWQGAVRHSEGGGGSSHGSENQQRPQPAPQHQPRHQHQVRHVVKSINVFKIRHQKVRKTRSAELVTGNFDTSRVYTYLLSPASHQQPTILKLSNLLFVFFSIQIKEWSCRDQTTTSIPNWPSPNRTEFNFQINCPIWMNKGKRVNHFQAFIRSFIFILFASLSLFLFSKQSDDPSVVIRSLWDAKQRHMVFLGQINATYSESFIIEIGIFSETLAGTPRLPWNSLWSLYR